MARDRLGALKAAQSEDEQDDDMQMDTGNAQYMEEFFEQVCLSSFKMHARFHPSTACSMPYAGFRHC